jgi:hypothetical protein
MVRHPRMPHEVAVLRDASAGLMGARIVVAGGTPKRAELSLMSMDFGGGGQGARMDGSPWM